MSTVQPLLPTTEAMRETSRRAAEIIDSGNEAFSRRRQMRQINVGDTERVVSIASGLILMGLGAGRLDFTGLLIAGLGLALTQRGHSGHCATSALLGHNTAQAG